MERIPREQAGGFALLIQSGARVFLTIHPSPFTHSPPRFVKE